MNKRNYLTIASEIFRHAKQSHYLKENPFDDLTNADRKSLYGQLIESDIIKFLSIEQAENLINFTATQRPEFLATIVLGLFCGLRTEELGKITWDKVNLEEGLVTVDVQIAKKRRRRYGKIPDNCLEWLNCVKDKNGRVAPAAGKRFERQYLDLRLKAGFKDERGRSSWPSNGLRHSFAT